MSKFTEQLKQVFQTAPQPMGFRMAKSTPPRPRIQLVVSLNADTDGLEKLEGAADAVFVPASYKGNGDVLKGIKTSKGTAKEIEQAKENGADYAVVPVTGAAVAANKEFGRILTVDPSITDVILRTVNELPIEGVLIDEKGDLGLNFQRLMLINRFGSMVSKPIVAKVAGNVTSEELRLIWDAGISGVVVDVAGEADINAVKKLRQVIDALPFPVRKKKDNVTITQVASPREEEHEEPDEDDDDD